MSLVFTHEEADALGDAIEALPDSLSIHSYEAWELRPDNRVGVNLYAVTESFPVFEGERYFFDTDGDLTHPARLDELWPSAPDYVEFFSVDYEDIRDWPTDDPVGIIIEIGISEDPHSDTRNITEVGLSELTDRLNDSWCHSETSSGLEQWSESVDTGSTDADDEPMEEHTDIDVLDPAEDADDPDPAFTVDFACGNCGRTFTYGFPEDVRVDYRSQLGWVATAQYRNSIGVQRAPTIKDSIPCPTCARKKPIAIDDRQPLTTEVDADA